MKTIERELLGTRGGWSRLNLLVDAIDPVCHVHVLVRTVTNTLSLLLVELLGTEVLRALPETCLHNLVGRSSYQHGKRQSHRHVLCFHIRQFLIDRRLVGRGERNRLHSVV